MLLAMGDEKDIIKASLNHLEEDIQGGDEDKTKTILLLLIIWIWVTKRLKRKTRPVFSL